MCKDKAGPEGGGTQEQGGVASTAGRCGPMLAGTMGACSCASIARRHRTAVFAALTAIGLAVLVLPVGAILGIIAFFRTL